MININLFTFNIYSMKGALKEDKKEHREIELRRQALTDIFQIDNTKFPLYFDHAVNFALSPLMSRLIELKEF